MNSKKHCHRCERLIDDVARICPFCNQEQVIESIDGGQKEVTEPSPAPVNPISSNPGESLARRIVYGVGAVVGIVGMFFVGWLVYALGQPDSQKNRPEAPAAPEQAEERPAPDLTLVADGSGAPDIERAYTSRLTESLNEDLPEEFQRRDATALPIAVYKRVAEQEKRREEERRATFVDPREVTQAARPRSRPRPQPEPATDGLSTADNLGEIPGTTSPETGAAKPAGQAEERASGEESSPEAPLAASSSPQRTRPQPLSQPLPRIVSRTGGSVRVALTIGSDGEVSSVKVLQGLPGVTPQVVSAVNRWKFQAATVNGQPVESTYEVEIVVKPNR